MQYYKVTLVFQVMNLEKILVLCSAKYIILVNS
jgi:hypothetical protein